MTQVQGLTLDPVCEKVLESLYRDDMHMGHDGNMHKRNFATRIDPALGRVLTSTILEYNCQNVLETGFAYGFSTLYILGAVKQIPGGTHTAIDPFEIDKWNGIGLEKVKQVQAESQFIWIPKTSIVAFGELVEAGKKFDMVFIDSSHLFDHALMEIYGADAVLNVGGIMAFDDIWMPSVRAAVAFVDTNYTHYRRIPTPEPWIVMYQKVEQDKRRWFHFHPFAVPPTHGAWEESWGTDGVSVDYINSQG